jgi:hypothetical protein
MTIIKHELGIVETLDFEDSVVLTISKKWYAVLNDPIVFEARIENNELVLSTPLKVNKTSSKGDNDVVK